MSEDAKKLEKLIFFLDMEQKEFYLSIPNSANILRSISSGESLISRDLAYKIIEVYPRISFKWLFHNKGYITTKLTDREVQKEIYLLALSTNKSTRIISMWVQIMCWVSVISFLIIVAFQLILIAL